MSQDEFITEIFELAFGDAAFHYDGNDVKLRGFSYQEVFDELKELCRE